MTAIMVSYARAPDVSLMILGKPPAKSNQRGYSKGRIHNSNEVAKYESDFGKQVTQKCRGLKHYDGLLEVEVFVFAVGRRQDVDSYPKSIFDCLQKFEVIKNDNRFENFHVYRKIDKKRPRVVINIWKL